MAMHNSQDVGNTVITLFNEVVNLGLDKTIRCGIGILQEGPRHGNLVCKFQSEGRNQPEDGDVEYDRTSHVGRLDKGLEKEGKKVFL